MCLGGGWNQLYLNADAALQLELQPDHVHLGGGAQEPQLGHLGAHLIDGHLDGAEVRLVLVHDGDALLHVGETVGGWAGGAGGEEGEQGITHPQQTQQQAAETFSMCAAGLHGDNQNRI